VHLAKLFDEDGEGRLFRELRAIQGLPGTAAEKVTLGVDDVVEGVQHLGVLRRGLTGGDGLEEFVIGPCLVAEEQADGVEHDGFS
jgi:hypothetical protein